MSANKATDTLSHYESKTMSQFIYKICPETLWREAESKGVFNGAGIDLADGYIHFSTAAQTADTARLHFHGQQGLILAKVDISTLDIVWEESRGGSLFPHLYGPLPMQTVTDVIPIPLDGDDVPCVPDDLA